MSLGGVASRRLTGRDAPTSQYGQGHGRTDRLHTSTSNCGTGRRAAYRGPEA